MKINKLSLSIDKKPISGRGASYIKGGEKDKKSEDFD